MRIHTTHSRDAALRELHRINRWMIAGSVLLTGVLSDVAAHAFPGKHVKTTTSTRRSAAKHTHLHHPHKPLSPPSHAPSATTQQPAQIQGSPAAEATQSHESEPVQESVPTQEQAPAPEPLPEREAAPAQETAPAPEPAPEREAPVVSGGS